MNMQSKICVLGYSEWFIEADNKRGVSLHYLNSGEETNPSKHGFMPVKKSVTDEVIASIRGQKFPLVCEMDFTLITKGNGMDININSLKPLNHVSLYDNK